jgi:hypothetical protein
MLLQVLFNKLIYCSHWSFASIPLVPPSKGMSCCVLRSSECLQVPPKRWYCFDGAVDLNFVDFLFNYFFYLVCEAIGTAATPGLFCLSRVIVKMIVEKQMECRLAGETEVLGENLPQRRFCPSHNPTWPERVLNPGRRGGKPASNRLSYGAALIL